MSRRRRVGMVLGVTVVTAVAVALSFYAAIGHRPSFYSPEEAPGPVRRERAAEFVERTLQLRNDAANEERWEAVFSQDQVNAWLAEDLPAQFPDLLPASIRDPRIVFEADRATIGFTYEDGALKGVVWAVIRVETGEDNALTLEVEDLRFGLIPIPDGLLVDRIRGGSRLPLAWSRSNGHAVATIRLDPKQRGQSLQIEQVQLTQGRLRVAGQSSRNEPRQVEAARSRPPVSQRSL